MAIFGRNERFSKKLQQKWKFIVGINHRLFNNKVLTSSGVICTMKTLITKKHNFLSEKWVSGKPSTIGKLFSPSGDYIWQCKDSIKPFVPVFFVCKVSFQYSISENIANNIWKFQTLSVVSAKKPFSRVFFRNFSKWKVKYESCQYFFKKNQTGFYDVFEHKGLEGFKTFICHKFCEKW